MTMLQAQAELAMMYTIPRAELALMMAVRLLAQAHVVVKGSLR